MFKRKRRAHSGHVRETEVSRARGGVSLGAVLTGVVVAFGAMFLLSALVGGVLAATGTTVEEVADSGAVEASIATGIALVAAQLIAYLWGGYTAGRMGRGAGFANGLLVPLVALLLALAVGAIATAMGATAQLNVPFETTRLPIEGNNAVDFGTGIAIAALIAMFIGGIIGGLMGSRWHTKLERRVIEEHVVEHPAEDERVGSHRHLTPEEEARAAEERRRLSDRAATRRENAPTAEQPPAPPAERAPEPVVTRHNTTR